MRTELAARRQHGKHGAVDARDRIQQLDGFRTQLACRGKKVVVPFEIKAFPAALEERIEASVVVLGGRPDKSLIEQPHRFLADGLPVVSQLGKSGKCSTGITGWFGTAEPAYISTL